MSQLVADAESGDDSLRVLAGSESDGVLGWALFLSLVLHLLGWGAVRSGLVDELVKVDPMVVETISNEMEVPIVFIDVAPEDATEEPVPDDTKFYSARSSLAANPDPASVLNSVPRIDGEQEEILRTETIVNPREEPSTPAEASTQAVAPPLEVLETVERKPDVKPIGDLAMVRPEAVEEAVERVVERPVEIPNPVEAFKRPAEQSVNNRPRTLAAAKRLAGEKMYLDGGVERFGRTSLFDVKGNVFGAYDEAMRMAVQDRWYSLLREKSYAHLGGGKVTISFVMHSDGRITSAVIKYRNVDLSLAVFCLSALTDPSPYAEWPPEMLRLMGEDRRELEFNFFYH